MPVAAALVTCQYASPMMPEDSRILFEAACNSVGLDGEPDIPLRASRAFGTVKLLSREWGMTDLEDRISRAIEASYEPTWDRTTGEFTWGLGLDEDHPRGQYNAFLAAAEAGSQGAWSALSARPVADGPKVVGVDFPSVALSEARFVDGVLEITVAPLRPEPTAQTTFRVTGLPPGNRWIAETSSDAAIDVTTVAVAETPTVEVTVPIDAISFRIRRSG